MISASAAYTMEMQLLAGLVAIFGLILISALLLAPSRTPVSKFWDSQPCVGQKKQFLSWARATLRSIKGSQSMAAEGYAKVCFRPPDFDKITF